MKKVIISCIVLICTFLFLGEIRAQGAIGSATDIPMTVLKLTKGYQSGSSQSNFLLVERNSDTELNDPDVISLSNTPYDITYSYSRATFLALFPNCTSPNTSLCPSWYRYELKDPYTVRKSEYFKVSPWISGYLGQSIHLDVYPQVNIYKVVADPTLIYFADHQPLSNLKVNNGCAGAWQYRLEGTTNWENVDSSQQQEVLTGEPSNLLGMERAADYMGKKIYFRIKRSFHPDVQDYSNEDEYLIIRPGVPKVTNTIITPPRCAGEKGSVEVTLARAARSSEELDINWEGVTVGATDIEWLSPTKFLLKNRPTKPIGLKSLLKIAGFYRLTSMQLASEPNIEIPLYEVTPLSYTEVLPNHTDISCFGDNTGSFKVQAEGGAGGYKLKLKKQSESGFTERIFDNTAETTVSGLSAGTYGFYVVDANGCELRGSDGNIVIRTVAVTAPAAPVSFNFLYPVEPTGHNVPNGSLTIEVEGGTPISTSGFYTVEWKEKQTGIVKTTVNNELINGKFRSTLHTISGATYIAKVTDSKGCVLSQEYTLNQPKLLEVTIENTLGILCNGDSVGQLVAHAKGGVLATGEVYSYQWLVKNGANFEPKLGYTDSIASNLPKGIYQVEIKDKSNPVNSEKSAAFTLNEPIVLTTTLTQQNISCHAGNNGFIRIIVQGGVGNYKLYYKLQSEVTYQQTTVNTPNTFLLNNLTAGTYMLYIVDGNNCRAKINGNDQETVILTEPATAVTINNTIVVRPTAPGLSNGSITIKIEGGNPNSTAPQYSVVWKKGTTVIASSNSLDGNNLFTSSINNLAADSYTVEIKDKNFTTINTACYLSNTFTLLALDPLTVTVEQQKNVLCNGESTGELVAHAQGGAQMTWNPLPYVYKWYTVNAGVETLIPNASDSILGNRPQGDYRVKIEDGSTPTNTIVSNIISIMQPDLLVTTLTKQDVNCYGENNGFIRIAVQGGVGNYKMYYKLSSESTYQQITVNAPTNTFLLSNLIAGTYSIYILDGNNCYAKINGNTTAEIVISQPPKALTIVSAQQTDPTGFGRSDGTIMLKIDGGTPNSTGARYNVVWKKGALTLPSVNTIDGSDVFTSQISNLTGGTYTVEIKDKNFTSVNSSCYISSTFSLVTPKQLTLTVEKAADILCNGENTGKLIAHAQGGVLPVNGTYIYNWYRVNGSTETLMPSATDSILHNISAGDYKVQVTDRSTLVNSITSGVITISQPTQLVTNLSKQDVSCFGGNNGFIRIAVQGGAGNYKLFYKQATETIYRQMAVNLPNNTFLLSNLLAGTYSIYILDGNNCYAKIDGNNFAEITLTQPAKALTIASTFSLNPSGFNRTDGSIKIVIEGGTPNTDNTYHVVWKNSSGQIVTATPSFEGGKYVSLLSNLASGQYTVEVTDKQYASTPEGTNATCYLGEAVTLTQPNELLVSIENKQVISCNGMADGQLVAHAKGGIVNPVTNRLPYKYKWYEQIGGVYTLMLNRTDSILSSVPAGFYRLIAEDYSRVANIMTKDYQLVQPGLLTANATNTHVVCGQTTTVSVTVTGGTAPYQYMWSMGPNTPSVSNVGVGKYLVFITDARGCQTTALARVTSPENMQVSATTSDPICKGASNGSVSVQVSGGTVPYAYLWSNGSTSKDQDNLTAGNYTLTITDNTGCTYTEGFLLTEPQALTLDLGADKTLCRGQSVTLESTVADPNTKFDWTGPASFSSTQAKVTVKNEGTYKLTITDSKGCQATDEMKIEVKDMDISSEIVVASQVFVNDTIIIVNISHPEPERMEWLITPGDSLSVIETADHYAKIKFTEKGYYTIGFRTYMQDCSQDVLKNITVIDKDENFEGGFGESLIKKFQVYPNPNSGVFNVTVELNRISAIRLRLIHLGTGNIVSDKKHSGEQKYLIPYNIHLHSSAYIFVLETASGRMNVKMIIE